MVSRAVREEVLARDGAKCTECGAEGTRKIPLQMHHVRYLCRGGKSNPENLKTMCFLCHRELHRFDKPIKRRKKKKRGRHA